MQLHVCRLSGHRVTKRLTYACWVLILFLSPYFNTTVIAQVKKNVSIENMPTEKAFDKIAQLYKVRFFYTGSTLTQQQNIQVPAGEKSLEEILQYLSNEYKFVFKRTNNMISVSLQSASQEKIVKGRVGLFEGDGIIYNAGIVIREEGTQNAAITDDKGYFSIKLKSTDPNLLISCIGYETASIKPSGQSQVNVTLQQAINKIPEVVIATGYQNLAKKNTTGAYASINEKTLERRSSQSIEQVLEGAIPGLTIATSYSGPSSSRSQGGMDIQIRGGSAVQSNRNGPLIIVDGFPVNKLPDNLNDVAKIDVLKDAAAAAIWGARASNGVIVITTRRGKEGKINIQYASNVYFTSRPDYSQLRRAGAADLVDYDKELYDKGFIIPEIFEGSYSGYSPSFDLLFKLNRGLLTDAEFQQKQDSLGSLSNSQQVHDLLLRTGIRQNHYLSLSGGGKGYRFMVSGSFDKGKSVYLGNESQSVQLNTRSDFELTRSLRLSVDMNAVFQDAQSVSGLSSDLQQLPPYQLLVDPQGNYLYDYTQFNKVENDRLIGLGYADNGKNLLQEARIADNNDKSFAIRSNVTGEWKIAKGLSLRSSFLYDRLKSSKRYLIPQDAYSNRSFTNRYTTLDADNKAVYNLPQGQRLDRGETTNNNWAWRSQLNYTNMFDAVHFVSVVGGFELKKYVTEGYTTSKFGYNDDLLSWQPVDQKTLLAGGLTWWDGSRVPIFDAGSYDRFSFNDVREKSYYATATYTYDDRYTVTGSYRVDQSNLFGVDPKYRNNPLWSAGLAWDISREDFFRSDLIDLLKIRATVGLTGNFDATTTPLLVASKRYQAALNDFAARVSSYNPKLRWERTRTVNVGTDISLDNGRIQVSLDAYNKYGYDLYGSQTLDPTVGFTSMKINAAKMTNRGVEIAVQAKVLQLGDFKWDTRLNAGYNRNKITENRIADGNPEINRVTGTSQYVEGYNRESIWSYRWAGLDNRGNPTIYGEKDEVIKVPVLASLIHSGTYRAPFSGGFTNIFTYKQLFFSVFTTFNFGNVLRREMPDMYGYSFSDALNYQVKDRWRKPGDESHTDIAAITPSFDPEDFYDGRERVMMYSSNSIIPGDYIRLREMQIGYNLPQKLIRNTPFKNVNFIAQMNNVALWKKNKYGIDPEAIDPLSGAYYLPLPRITTLTVRVEL